MSTSRQITYNSSCVQSLAPLLHKEANSNNSDFRGRYNCYTQVNKYIGCYDACRSLCITTMRPRQNGRHFPDGIFKCIFLNGNVQISIKILLKFVPNDLIKNNPALDQIMAWRLQGDKPLSEPIMFRLPTHICVTRPQ